jgi:hypothetical protein
MTCTMPMNKRMPSCGDCQAVSMYTGVSSRRKNPRLSMKKMPNISMMMMYKRRLMCVCPCASICTKRPLPKAGRLCWLANWAISGGRVKARKPHPDCTGCHQPQDTPAKIFDHPLSGGEFGGKIGQGRDSSPDMPAVATWYEIDGHAEHGGHAHPQRAGGDDDPRQEGSGTAQARCNGG